MRREFGGAGRIAEERGDGGNQGADQGARQGGGGHLVQLGRVGSAQPARELTLALEDLAQGICLERRVLGDESGTQALWFANQVGNGAEDGPECPEEQLGGALAGGARSGLRCLGLGVRPGGTVAMLRASTSDQASIVLHQTSDDAPVPPDAANTGVVADWPG